MRLDPKLKASGLQKPINSVFCFDDNDERAEPPSRPVRYGAAQLFLNSSACSSDPKFRQPAIESIVLDL